MKTFRYLSHACIALLLVAATACGGGEEAPATGDTSTPAEGTAPGGQDTTAGAGGDLVAQGQTIFAGPGICFTCHGADATGTQLAPNLTDDEWINIEQPVTQDKIVQLVRTGVPQPKQHPAPMPPMGGAQLSEDQIQAVSAYVYSLSR